jgi:hypothetical protein
LSDSTMNNIAAVYDRNIRTEVHQLW